MNCRSCVFSIPLFLVASRTAIGQPIQLVNAFPNVTFTQPILLTNAHDGTNRVFVVQQNGLIRVFQNDSAVASSSVSTFLNITNKLSSTGGEEGLLGLAFHPNYTSNGYFYVNYTAPSPRRTVVARYSVMSGNPNKADSLSEYKIIEIGQPYTNHNGGMIFFGLDGYLYIGLGDGGSGGDPQNRAQNLDSLLGKILRINVNSETLPLRYSIPPDNPLVGLPGRDEIFAWGMRNPWRLSQDPVTGNIFAGDVGQGSWEEVDLIENGLNYGWRCYEGDHPYNTAGCGSISNYTFPLKEYSHSFGCSVTGGYVYRGYKRPDLVGSYIYGDYCSGMIWKFRYDNGQVTEDTILVDAPFSISSFGVDEYGELYICNYGGNIQRFVGGPPVPTTTLVYPGYSSADIPVPTTARWRQAPGAIKYWLEVDDNAGFTSLAVQDSTLTDTTYLATALNLNTQYYWRVRVKNSIGWGNFSAVWSFTTVPPVPIAPALVSPPDAAPDQPLNANLTWNGSLYTASYRVQVSADSLFGSTVLDDSTVTDTSKQVIALANSTVYHWRVSAKNGAGTSPWSDMWSFETTEEVTRQYGFSSGWNLLSVPLIVGDRSTTTLFPNASSSAFAYTPGTGYSVVDTLLNGSGYWLKFPSTQFVNITGLPLAVDTIDVVAGWNIIGSIDDTVETSTIIEVPPGIVQSGYFEYTFGTGYQQNTVIKPARAYWVKIGGSGQLILGPTSAMPSLPKPALLERRPKKTR